EELAQFVERVELGQKRPWAWAFLGGFGMVSAMSEIFVAQYFGAKKLEAIGGAVWQMIWFAFFSTFFFLPMAFFGPALLFPQTGQALHSEYFSYLMLFGPFYTLMTALSGFYIGRGKARILIYLAILGNVLNIYLDSMLIFGVPGFIPEMGIKGAAIATSLGYVFQAIILFVLFLQKRYRATFKTGHWKIHTPLFCKSLRVGLPQGVFYMLEMMGFAIFYELMRLMSKDHILISGICQSFVILLSFFIEGLTKGVTAIAGQCIGGKKPAMVKQVLRAGVYLQCLFSLIMAAGFLAPNHLVSYLFPDATEYIVSVESKESMEALWFCLFCSFLYLSFEGVRWVIAGVLTAAGDTLFLLVAGSLSVWLLLIFPIYFIVLKHALSVGIAWTIFAVYSFACCALYFYRFQRGSWKNINLIEK
ncbi:MAG: MATE family efflux transporter, partial [Chlamydiota bacterium]